MANISDGLIKKTAFVPFLDVSKTSTPSYKRIKKSTTFSLSFNPQSKTFDFISSDSPHEEIDSYQPSLSQSLTMFKGDDDFEAIFDLCYHLPTGGDAHRNVILGFIASYCDVGEEGAAVRYYKAWAVDAVVKLGTLDSVAQSIDFDLALNDHEEVAITLDGSGAPTIVKGTWNGDTFTPASNQ